MNFSFLPLKTSKTVKCLQILCLSHYLRECVDGGRIGIRIYNFFELVIENSVKLVTYQKI
jgi:hypothetical protein